MINTYLEVLKKYAVFSGRAARNEYWPFVLINFVVAVLLAFPLGLLKGLAHVDLTFISHLYTLAVFCPGLAVGIRRLHDTDRSGWWLLLSLIPVIGSIAVLVFLCMEGSPSSNKFGEKP